MTGHVEHVPIILDRQWVVVGCDLVDGSVLGMEAEGRQNYREVPDGEDATSTGPWPRPS